jgi:hypothetical protein
VKEAIMSGIGAEVIAIDDTDGVGDAESATTIGEVTFQNVETFVDNVMSELGDRWMSLLHIQVHGNPTGIWFGRDHVTVNTFVNYRRRFAQLSEYFTDGAWVDLRACEVGQNLPLLHKFRELWGVGIVAGRGLQYNVVFEANLGRYQIVTADGEETKSLTVPPWVAYDVGRRAVRGILSRIF